MMSFTQLLKSTFVLSGTLAILAVSTSSLADSPKNGDKQWLLSKYDLNGDSVITQDEVSAKRDAIFSYMDANSDGGISFKEYSALDSIKRQTLLKARFNKLDVNLDGDVSQQEYRSYSGQFSAIDSDGDGNLTASEINSSTVKRKSGTHCLLWFCVRTSLKK